MMIRRNKTYLWALAGLCMAGSLSAQTASEAQKMFQNGQYAEAKPAFGRLVKQSPANANYNFWYGACCYETGEAEAAIPYLEKSAARRVTEAYGYLAKACYQTYRFDEAVANAEEYIAQLEKKKKDTAEAEEALARYRMGARMFRGVEKVAVIDSFAVSKAAFLDAYRLSSQAGTVALAGDNGCTRFVNEMGDKMVTAQTDEQGDSHLYVSNKLIDRWETPRLIDDLEETGTSLNYPFVDSDGITLYFAAQGEESLGGYDIFVTRFDTEDNSYLRPTNLGMPFNSPYNDYLYAVDDFNGLGWFASDRFQPADSVCVYVFAPNDTKEVFDYDLEDEDSLRTYASLSSIQATWTDEEKVRLAKQQLAQAIYGSEEAKKAKGDFTFIVSDRYVYHVLDDFRSSAARQLYQELSRMQQDLEAMRKELDQKRQAYAEAGQSARAGMAPAMLDQEKRIDEMYEEIGRLTTLVRNTELKARM